MKKLLLLFLAASTTIALTGCGDKEYEGVDGSVTGSIDIMMWNGDGKYHKDLGNMSWTKDDITAQTVADVYAVAKEFKNKYPNVSVNLQTKAYGPNDAIDGVASSWETEIELFKTNNGNYPDIWVSDNVTRDMSKGLIFDMSYFENDATYKTYNPALLEMTNFYGFQAGIPQYAIPYGVYVNRDLADKNNIDAPEVNWTWDEYTEFVAEAPTNKDIYGSWDASMSIVRSTLIERQLQTNSVVDAYINANTTEFKKAIENLPTQAQTAILSQQGEGQISDDFMSKYGNYPFYFFSEGALLTLRDTIGASELGNAHVSGLRSYVQSEDWDIYPTPDMGEGNQVNIIYDPMVMYNQADANGDLDEAGEAQVKLAYEFMSFYSASTDAWQARSEQQFKAMVDTSGNVVYKSALTDSLPLITGDEYAKQMAIWYSLDNHAPYKDADDFPGWHYTVELWEEGNIAGVSDKAYPLTYRDDANNEINCLFYIDEFGMGDNSITSPSWYDDYVGGLAAGNFTMNERFNTAYENIRTALTKYYGFKDKDFK